MRRIARLAPILLALALPAVAQAHPVSPRRAEQAVRSYAWGFTPAPTVDGCAVDHYGTLCTVESAICYDDPTFGPAVDVDTERVWVSRTHRQVAVAILPGTQTSIWAAPPGCGVGAQP